MPSSTPGELLSTIMYRLGESVCIENAHFGNWTEIGRDSQIHAYTHLGHGIKIGQNTTLAEGIMVGGYADIGNRVRIGRKSSLADAITLDDDVISCRDGSIRRSRLVQHRGEAGQPVAQTGARRAIAAHQSRHRTRSAKRRPAAPDGRARASANTLAANGGGPLGGGHHLLYFKRVHACVRGVHAAGLHVDPAVATACVIPFVLVFVAWTVRRIRKKHFSE